MAYVAPSDERTTMPIRERLRAFVTRHPRPGAATRLSALWVLLAVAVTAGRLPAPAPALRSFDRVQLLEPNGETSAGVSVGDLNGDGLPDIVLGKGRHWPLFNRVLLNDGRGGFIASDLGSAPDRTYSAALADVDGDSHLDIVVSNDDPDRKVIYRNDGKGHFSEFGTFGDPKWSTRYITLVDLNGDGYPDIVAANRGDYPDLVHGKPGQGPHVPTSSYVCLNDRTGHFPKCDALPSESATSIVAADFDGDGAVDLFVPHRDGGQSLMLWNDGTGHFTSTPIGPAHAWIRMGAAGDLDGNGRPDLVIIDEALQSTFILHNRGHRQFDPPKRLPVPKRHPYCVAIADLNRDGRPDIVVGYVETPGSILFNAGHGHSFKEVRWNDGTGTVYGVAFADFDGDGWPDIVAARTDAPNAVWYSTAPPAGEPGHR